jgi:hypothetical protein
MMSHKAHAVVDYITVGSFLLGTGFFWQRTSVLLSAL